MEEFDYREEAKAMAAVRENLIKAGVADENPTTAKKLCLVPKPYLELCTESVLVMEELPGEKLADALKQERKSTKVDKKDREDADRQKLQWNANQNSAFVGIRQGRLARLEGRQGPREGRQEANFGSPTNCHKGCRHTKAAVSSYFEVFQIFETNLISYPYGGCCSYASSSHISDRSYV